MKRNLLTKGLVIGALGLLALTGCGGGYRYDPYYSYAPPPPPRVENYGRPPGPDHVWINGYWGYSNRNYAWAPGRWERPPRRGTHWHDGRWDRDGRGYRYRNGYWR